MPGTPPAPISAEAQEFLASKVQSLAARARRLAKLTPRRVGLRPQDRPYAPSAAHFEAANRRLSQIDGAIDKRLQFLQKRWRAAKPQRALVYMALLEREIDRARRTFGMFFELFSQRGSAFAPALAAHDAIAADCYATIRATDPLLFDGPLLKPLTYLEHGYSPATMRRGVTLARLLGERNPFPVIRIPWDRDNPWQSVFLHETAHNVQADLRLWQENQDAVSRRVLRMSGDALVTTTYRRWHKEIFADLAALLLGGPSSAWGMVEFLAHPRERTLTFIPGGAHPTAYLRAFILAEMMRRMGFGAEAARMSRVWRALYDPSKGHRLPGQLLRQADRVIPAVVDEIAYQPRRNLGQRALADIIRFTRADESRIRAGASSLVRGQMPSDLPPRFLVSASRVALHRGAPARELSNRVIHHLAQTAGATRELPLVAHVAAAA